MRLTYPTRLFALVAVVCVLFAGRADAGWLTIKNDTTKTIIIQDTITTNGQVKHGTAIRLLPGETIREFRTTPTAKSIVVFDSRKPTVSLFRGELKCTCDRQTFTVTCDGTTTSVKSNSPQNPSLAKK